VPPDGKTLGVLLFNLGGPETLADVRPFLFNLFSDPEIIRIRNGFLRRAVAGLIASTRAEKSRGYYKKIGGGSPLRRITEAQAGALADALAERGLTVRPYVGMQCWKPTIDEAVARIAADGIERLAVIPLYPQFSVTTTGSALRLFYEALRRHGLERIERHVVRQWFDHPGYVGALAETVRDALEGFSERDPGATSLLYSAHSIPVRYVDEGDPYLAQTQRTVALVNERLGHQRPPSILAFQSKVGPVKWLEPATDEVIRNLGRRVLHQLLVVPVSFVSDHIETLYEIDILYRELAATSGILRFRRAASLNLSPAFIGALADIAEDAFAAIDERAQPEDVRFP
jgi:protoporphyrin/coproporphyrin ferrochelatase